MEAIILVVGIILIAIMLRLAWIASKNRDMFDKWFDKKE